jgi:hypothetical protein
MCRRLTFGQRNREGQVRLGSLGDQVALLDRLGRVALVCLVVLERLLDLGGPRLQYVRRCRTDLNVQLDLEGRPWERSAQRVGSVPKARRVFCGRPC